MKFYLGLEGISNIIAALGWKRFEKGPKAAIESLVWECFANFPDVIDNRVKVRNVLVPFVPNDIKIHYFLVKVREGEYEQYLNNVDYN